MNELKILESDQWPSTIPPGFGENEIESLFRRLRLKASKTKTKKNAYRDYLKTFISAGKKQTSRN